MVFKELNVEVWNGDLDTTKPGSIVNATISVSDTNRYGVYANYDIDKRYIDNIPKKIKFNGVIKYTIYHKGYVLDTQTVRSSYGWQGWNNKPDNFWSELMFEFWMPYNDKYNNITLEMEVIEADPASFDNRENIYWSVKGNWTP